MPALISKHGGQTPRKWQSVTGCFLQDDNFSSIVKTVLWGRSVFSNLRKFLQFQLTVNGVALVIAFVAAVTNGDTPLNVLELLWVNLIMDAMAALGMLCSNATAFLHHDSSLSILHV